MLHKTEEGLICTNTIIDVACGSKIKQQQLAAVFIYLCNGIATCRYECYQMRASFCLLFRLLNQNHSVISHKFVKGTHIAGGSFTRNVNIAYVASVPLTTIPYSFRGTYRCN